MDVHYDASRMKSSTRRYRPLLVGFYSSCYRSKRKMMSCSRREPQWNFAGPLGEVGLTLDRQTKDPGGLPRVTSWPASYRTGILTFASCSLSRWMLSINRT